MYTNLGDNYRMRKVCLRRLKTTGQYVRSNHKNCRSDKKKRRKLKSEEINGITRNVQSLHPKGIQHINMWFKGIIQG
jgi:hypothetical protein